MRIRELMSSNVETTTPFAPLSLAREQMRRRGIRHLVVVRHGTPCGILSEHDFVGRGAAAPRSGGTAPKTVEEVMTPLAVTIRSDATARQAANLMRGRKIGCLPVVDGTRLVGIVTISDLLEMIGRGRAVLTGPRGRAVLPKRGPRGAARSLR